MSRFVCVCRQTTHYENNLGAKCWWCQRKATRASSCPKTEKELSHTTLLSHVGRQSLQTLAFLSQKLYYFPRQQLGPAELGGWCGKNHPSFLQKAENTERKNYFDFLLFFLAPFSPEVGFLQNLWVPPPGLFPFFLFTFAGCKCQDGYFTWLSPQASPDLWSANRYPQEAKVWVRSPSGDDQAWSQED